MKYIIKAFKTLYYLFCIIWMIPVFALKHAFAAVYRAFMDWKAQCSVIKTWIFHEYQGKH